MTMIESCSCLLFARSPNLSTDAARFLREEGEL
jgi:hypothetical protein